MSEEWRKLPEFPKYEITADGDLRNRWTKKRLRETQNKYTGAWAYCVRREDGSSTQRNFWGLVYSAYPELEPVKVEKTVRLARPYGVWTDVPGFPKYQAHPDGRVRYKASRRMRKLMHDVSGTPYCVLFDENGDASKVKVRRILRDTFPVLVEAA